MGVRRLASRIGLLLTLTALVSCASAERLADRAGWAAEREAGDRVDRGVHTAASEVEEAILSDGTDGNTSDAVAGRNSTAESGGSEAPIHGRESSQDTSQDAGSAGRAGPGEGVWANYDFVPGELVLFAEDFTEDDVGDFPRRLEFVKGSWEVVEWEGQRFLRSTGGYGSAFNVPLPESLPDRFTIEFDLFYTDGLQMLVVVPSAPELAWQTHPGHMFQVRDVATGVVAPSRGVESTQNVGTRLMDAVTVVRIMVDGRYAKLYLNEERVANIPNAEFVRGDKVHFNDAYYSDAAHPIYIGSMRIAAGGKDLYDVLARDGRVATRGIYFDTDSDRLRPESTPTLKEIGTMLQEHSDLSLRIEGHTDSLGEEAYNQELSERRATAVRAYLMEAYGIDGGRLEAAGLGESAPIDTNETPEGQQNNRRVELVRVE